MDSFTETSDVAFVFHKQSTRDAKKEIICF